MTELAFTEHHVARLTGLSPRQLRYWHRSGFFRPAIADDEARGAYARLYSFRDLVGLRTIAILRNVHGVPLQELRRVGAWLCARHEEPWSTLRFALRGRKVVFFDPGAGVAVEPRGAGQEVLPIALEPIAEEMRAAAERLRERTREQVGQLERNRQVLHNAWVVAGTRIPTSAIWNFHEAGCSVDEILAEYPSLRPADVEAALHFERRNRSAA
jgi:DNA-binding transcriptional MerR regulator